jgi:hypothetical protein
MILKNIFLLLILSKAILSQTKKKVDFTVESLLVVDKYVIEKHQMFLKTNDTDIVLADLKIYLSHYMNGVCNKKI